MVIETQTRQFVTAQSGIASASNVAPENNCEALWCPRCEAVVMMVTPECGTVAAGVSARTIYRLVESGKVHFSETQDGALLICLSSLGEIAGDEATPKVELEVKTAPILQVPKSGIQE